MLNISTYTDSDEQYDIINSWTEDLNDNYININNLDENYINIINENIDNIRVQYHDIVSPEFIKNKYKLSQDAIENILMTRNDIKNILLNKLQKKLIVVGPCSIHSYEIAIEYAKIVKEWISLYGDKLLIIMRCYFEKPRTISGWKGLINDPDINDTYDINKGLDLARKILVEINNIGVPIACEMLDTIIPQYISDTISYGVIGARTVESQIHRELVSGLSFPIGFKNSTSGDIDVAIDSVLSVSQPHNFIGIHKNGRSSIVKTNGNKDCHIILRGGKKKTNYDYNELERIITNDIKILIDCSHDNTLSNNLNKNYLNQINVAKYILKNHMNKKSFIGIMLESNINEGTQRWNKKILKYGVSITDPCININQTKDILECYYHGI